MDMYVPSAGVDAAKCPGKPAILLVSAGHPRVRNDSRSGGCLVLGSTRIDQK
jgi:hypothetical protein